MDDKSISIEDSIKELKRLSDLIKKNDTSIDASMQALREATALSKKIKDELKRYDLALEEFSEKNEN